MRPDDLGPYDLLPEGTRVRVGNDEGYVYKAKMVTAHGGGEICLHTIRFDTKIVRGAGRAVKRKPVKPFNRIVNYSFIYRVGDVP